MGSILINSDSCKCPVTTNQSKKEDKLMTKIGRRNDNTKKLAILVPFRDRFEELLSFVPHMKEFLDKQNIDYHIFVLNQIDRYRFNRASLINVGFIYTKKNFDYIAMHDVDLLPINDNLSYKYPLDGPFHVSAPELHPRYHYKTFIGVNGMSNKYWGWGLEDDEFYVRLKEKNIIVYRPQNITTGTQNTFRHIHEKNHRKRDMVKCFNQKEATRKRDHQTGLDNISYKITKIVNITIVDIPLTILNIALTCDKSFTPWCECNKPAEITKKNLDSNL
ncbi:hypothetical protein HCN44_002010 [Aphidius gifuensis]|uniref:Beta-1,4-galactosyltransferase n=1 Tax=Aphidius gifuensis TaxID=684658 RepID=A0A835CWI0_APHGI|nr:hypothetical protein HCN44_002010 [Aphidius gifuensis]